MRSQDSPWTEITAQLDTGSTYNVMTSGTLRLLKKDAMDGVKQSDVQLRFYDGTMMRTHGRTVIELRMATDDRPIPLDFVIIDGPPHRSPLLSAETCEKLNLATVNLPLNYVENNTAELLTKDRILEELRDVFHGLGHLPGEYHIRLDPNVTPVLHAPRMYLSI